MATIIKSADPALRIPKSSSPVQGHFPAANTDATKTLAAPTNGEANCLSAVRWSYSVAPDQGAGKLTITVAGTTVFEININSAGWNEIQFNPHWQADAETAVILTLAAGGSGVTGKLNFDAYTCKVNV